MPDALAASLSSAAATEATVGWRCIWAAMLWGAPSTAAQGPARPPDIEAASAARLNIIIAPRLIAINRGMVMFPNRKRNILIASR
jgi:hypothetical protein